MRISHILVALTLSLSLPAFGALPGNDDESTVFVETQRNSAFIHILVKNHRRIGDVVIEVKDVTGELLYREEGKALTGELVRRLDKGVFPKGEHALTVQAKDFTITQRFNID